MSQERYDQMVAKLKNLGLRLTPQRLAILREVAQNAGHPSAEEIYRRLKGDFPTLSPATVYKTLALLKALGEVLELGFPDGVNRYNGRKPYPHPHVICLRCQTILDPDLGNMQPLLEAARQKTGFRILSHRFDLFGLCPACQQQEEGSGTAS